MSAVYYMPAILLEQVERKLQALVAGGDRKST